MKKLKSDSPIPLYYQLREIIRDKIISSEWEYGKEIPSELKLCDEFNLCRATVKQALDGLVNEGLIVRKKGKGSFVVYQKLDDNLLLEPSFHNMKSKNNILSNYKKLIFAEFLEPDNYLKTILNLNKNDLVFQVKRLYYVNNIPVALDCHYIHPNWSKNITEENLNELVIHKYIENTYDITFNTYKFNIQSVLLDQYEKELFDFPEIATGIVVESLSFIQNEAVLFNRKIYRGDRCNLSLEFNSLSNKMEIISSEVSVDTNKK